MRNRMIVLGVVVIVGGVSLGLGKDAPRLPGDALTAQRKYAQAVNDAKQELISDLTAIRDRSMTAKDLNAANAVQGEIDNAKRSLKPDTTPAFVGKTYVIEDKSEVSFHADGTCDFSASGKGKSLWFRVSDNRIVCYTSGPTEYCDVIDFSANYQTLQCFGNGPVTRRPAWQAKLKADPPATHSGGKV